MAQPPDGGDEVGAFGGERGDLSFQFLGFHLGPQIDRPHGLALADQTLEPAFHRSGFRKVVAGGKTGESEGVAGLALEALANALGEINGLDLGIGDGGFGAGAGLAGVGEAGLGTFEMLLGIGECALGLGQVIGGALAGALGVGEAGEKPLAFGLDFGRAAGELLQLAAGGGGAVGKFREAAAGPLLPAAPGTLLAVDGGEPLAASLGLAGEAVELALAFGLNGAALGEAGA